MRISSSISIFSIHLMLLMIAAPIARSRGPWISGVTPDVKLKKSNGSITPARPGPVDSTTQIIVGKNGRITVICSNNAKEKMPNPLGPQAVSRLCKEKTIQAAGGSKILPPMASPVSKMQPFATGRTGSPLPEGSLPQLTPVEGNQEVKPVEISELKKTSATASESPNILIITPRNTNILETKPVLRWDSVSDLNCCTVSVKGPEGTWIQQVEMTPDMVENSQIIYGGKTPLKPGNKYQFQVKSSNGAIGITNFEVLDDATAKRVKAEIAALQKKTMGEEAKVLALANLERENSLYSAAIGRLSKWLSKSSKNPVPYQLLADLYMQIELPEKARSPYITALDLTRKNRNPKEEVKSLREEGELLITLGIVDSALGDRTQSISWLEKAQQLYTKLKDNERIQEVKERLIDARAT